ncbi:GspH/FimT family protein [Thermus sp.]|uniref:GspH/FimT family protein n=1 Tax=Thermus sp. TaxID=275 RepID=UPI00321FF97D
MGPLVKRGLSLLELLVVLAVLGILGALAYTNYSAAYRLRAAGTELRTFLLAARTEAIRRGTGVAVVPEDRGLLSCVDENRNRACDPGEAPLRRFDPGGYGAALDLRSGFSPGLRFNALGRPNTGASLVLRLGGRSLTLCVGMGGRVREVSGDACS